MIIIYLFKCNFFLFFSTNTYELVGGIVMVTGTLNVCWKNWNFR